MIIIMVMNASWLDLPPRDDVALAPFAEESILEGVFALWLCGLPK
jgi:hypothetical protein